MEEQDFDMTKAQVLCDVFANKALEIGANTQTSLLAAMRIFMTILMVITTPDPETGRKYERMRKMVPGMMDAYNADYPIDEED